MSINCVLKQAIVVLILISTHTFSQDEIPQELPTGEELLKSQKETLSKIMVDINKSSKKVYETFTSKPMGVVESGCLSDLRGVDFSALVIDPADLLAGIYKSLKEEMYNLACEAASEEMNKISKQMDKELELPVGMGDIGVGQGNNIGKSTGNLINSEVAVDSSEAAADITNSVLGEVRVSKYKASKNIDRINIEEHKTNRKKTNTKSLVEKVEKFLNVDILWKGDESNESGGANNE